MSNTTPASETVFVGVVETAKLIRAELKREFPGVKFSVRCDQYSMGASVRIGWTNGPSRNAVESVCDQYRGEDFDGMTDSRIQRYRLVDGRRVNYGADHISYSRREVQVAPSVTAPVDRLTTYKRIAA